MRRNPFFTLVCVAAVLAGCGDDDASGSSDAGSSDAGSSDAAITSDAGADGGGAPQIDGGTDAGSDAGVDRFPECATWASAVCARFAECSPAFFLWASGGTIPACELSMRTYCVHRRTTPDVASLEAVEAYEQEYLAWVSEGCDWPADFLQHKSPEVPPGQRDAGEPCSTGDQCGVASVEGREVRLRCRGVEASPEAPFGDSCETGTCALPALEGEACGGSDTICATELGLWCTPANRCAVRLADGEPCTTQQQCAPTSACFGSPRVCQPAIPLGEACVPGQDVCAGGFLVTCDAVSRRCVLVDDIDFLPGLGDRCDPFGAFCAPVGAECVEGTCVERRHECGVWACADGEVCIADRCTVPVCE